MDEPATSQDALYRDVVRDYGAALARLALAYEPDRTAAEDLIQDIHLAVWTSLASFAGRCSLRTWVYRVAHNTAVSQVTRRRGRTPAFVSLDDLAEAPIADVSVDSDVQILRSRLLALVQTLSPIDRQVIVLYMEEVDAASIAEIVGLSAGGVATRIHRIKKALAHRFHLRTER
jgi:RNA polymerase sigma-70 factor (ECF subfamily)